MAMKSRVATLLSLKNKGSKASIKKSSIDELRSEKDDLESRFDKLQEECTTHQQTAEDAQAAKNQAEVEKRIAVEEARTAKEESRVAKEELEKAQSGAHNAIEEKTKADEEKEAALRDAADQIEAAKRQASDAEASLAAATREAEDQVKRALEAQRVAEQNAIDEKAKREEAETAKVTIEQELERKVADALESQRFAEAERDTALKDVEDAAAARGEAERNALEEQRVREVAEAKSLEAQSVAEAKVLESQEAMLAWEEARIQFAHMEQSKLDAEHNAALEKAAREQAEVDMRLAEIVSRDLADQVRDLRGEKEMLLDKLQNFEESFVRTQEELVAAQTELANAAESRETIELESERRVEELTVLVSEWRDRAEDARTMKEDFERAAEKARDAQYDAQRQAEEYRRAKEKAETEKRNAEKLAQRLEAQAKKDREESGLRQEEAERNAKRALESLDDAQVKWTQGVHPTSSPSESQIDAIRKTRQFREGAFHVAVAGLTGTGKSSLINALMGIINGTPESIPTGTQSYTKAVGRYIDARRNYPHIWYDVPGAGTPSSPTWNYFNSQAIYVFDAVIVLWDNRLSEIDISVLNSCLRLKIPTFIVRSKSDTHVMNIEDRMRDIIDVDPTLTNKDRKSRYSVIPFSARAEYISETRQSVDIALNGAGLPSMKVYMVSNKSIQKIVQGDKNMRNVRIIDEFDLLNDIWALRRAIARSKSPALNRVNGSPRLKNMRANTSPLV
ncbi:hypothetical protein BDP27DRAFT_1421626 [Rhodocollybia butyracea]|uniref:IRG-type G domain-containing protein n=1 Tax=Rhodocollybia butyracea TaxID=206335 RepID=A0A9P5U8C3_9AGAR|nr:hypothetical protein BDP27DRAFT_1421626 [Rhodocollybia butyracea]